MTDTTISLAIADARDIANFKKDLQEAFAVAAIKELEEPPDGPIPSDADLDASMNAFGAVTLHILRGGEKIGGAVLTIDEKTHRNTLDLFFLNRGQEGCGFGHKAWCAIEKRYPTTRAWRTYTPYFEKRNIHFYVNKCGFKIIQFFNDRHPDPNHPAADGSFGEGFLFEKIM